MIHAPRLDLYSGSFILEFGLSRPSPKDEHLVIHVVDTRFQYVYRTVNYLPQTPRFARGIIVELHILDLGRQPNARKDLLVSTQLVSRNQRPPG